MFRRPPRVTLTDTHFPDTTPFRSDPGLSAGPGAPIAGGREPGLRLPSRRRAEAGHPELDRGEAAPSAARPGRDRGGGEGGALGPPGSKSEEHTSELQSLMRISYAVFCLTKIQVTNMTDK